MTSGISNHIEKNTIDENSEKNNKSPKEKVKTTPAKKWSTKRKALIIRQPPKGRKRLVWRKLKLKSAQRIQLKKRDQEIARKIILNLIIPEEDPQTNLLLKIGCLISKIVVSLAEKELQVPHLLKTKNLKLKLNR